MSKIVLFEDSGFANLLPMLYWRTVFELRCGRGSLAARIERLLGAQPAGLWTRAWIAEVAAERFNLPINQPAAAGDVLVNGRWLPDEPMTFGQDPVVGMCDGEIAYVVCDEQLARRLGPEHFLDPDGRSELMEGEADLGRVIETTGKVMRYPWDVITTSRELLTAEWSATDAAVEGEVHDSAVLLNVGAIRIERGARIMPGVVLDAADGPIVIEEGVKVCPHTYVGGPAYIACGSVINPHANIHGGTSVGPRCKLGGEIDACVFQGYSNKQHDGFLGHSYVGQWVNLGAGTVNSDLKNTYGTVRMPINGEPIDTGQMFVGAVIGDHAKTAIGTTIGTGSVIGFGANVVFSRLLPQFVRSFSWITDRQFAEGDIQKLAETAGKAMGRRNVSMTPAETALFLKLPQMVAYFEPAVAAQKLAFELMGRIHQATPVAQPEDPAMR